MFQIVKTTLVLVIVIAILNEVNSFTKYGRGCQDIGCMPNEVCIMVQDSCNIGQRDGKECGAYPTCKRNGAAAKPPSESNLQQKPTFNTNTNTDNSPYGGGNSGHVQTNSGLYPTLPNQNNQPGYPAVNPGGYVPQANPGGYVPQGYNPHGGQQPAYGGYQPQPHYNGDSNGNHGQNGGNMYNRGGYNNDPTPPRSQPKEKGNGFFSGILSNPHVSSAISGIIAGQIQKAITGGNGRNDQNQNGYQTNNNGGGGGGGSNVIGGLIGSYLAGGGGSSSSSKSSGSGLGLIGDLLGGGGNNQRNSGGSGGGGGFGDFFKSKQMGGLFNEKPTQSYSSGVKNYPTQPPVYG